MCIAFPNLSKFNETSFEFKEFNININYAVRRPIFYNILIWRFVRDRVPCHGYTIVCFRKLIIFVVCRPWLGSQSIERIPLALREKFKNRENWMVIRKRKRTRTFHVKNEIKNAAFFIKNAYEIKINKIGSVVERTRSACVLNDERTKTEWELCGVHRTCPYIRNKWTVVHAEPVFSVANRFWACG